MPAPGGATTTGHVTFGRGYRQLLPEPVRRVELALGRSIRGSVTNGAPPRLCTGHRGSRYSGWCLMPTSPPPIGMTGVKSRAWK